MTIANHNLRIHWRRYDGALGHISTQISNNFIFSVNFRAAQNLTATLCSCLSKHMYCATPAAVVQSWLHDPCLFYYLLFDTGWSEWFSAWTLLVGWQPANKKTCVTFPQRFCPWTNGGRNFEGTGKPRISWKAAGDEWWWWWWVVDWTAVWHQPSQSPRPGRAAVGKRVPRYTDEADSRRDPDPLGQHASVTVTMPTAGVQLHDWHQGFRRLYSPAESDRSEGRWCQHTGGECTLLSVVKLPAVTLCDFPPPMRWGDGGGGH